MKGQAIFINYQYNKVSETSGHDGHKIFIDKLSVGLAIYLFKIRQLPHPKTRLYKTILL